MPHNLQPDDPPHPTSPSTPLAPWPHTLAILVLLFVWAYLGHDRAHLYTTVPHTYLYLSASMMSWMLFGSIVAGIYNRRTFFFNTLQRNAVPLPKELLRAIAIYFGTLVLFLIAGIILHFTSLRHTVDRTLVEALAPHNLLELFPWLGVCITAGFCEEHIFRGYLLPQTIAGIRILGASPTQATILSVIITSLLFGSMHLYEGIAGAILITLLGALYAVMALRFRNLRAVIIAHTLQDFLVAVILLLHHALKP